MSKFRYIPAFNSENTVFLAPRSPDRPVEVTEEHCCCCEVKFEADTKPTAVPAAAATAAAAARGVSVFKVSDVTAGVTGFVTVEAEEAGTFIGELEAVAEAEVGESSS